MRHYEKESVFERKADNSPVTQADMDAHHSILGNLAPLTPQIPIISEESASHHLPEHTERFWLVDPLDGTKSFIRREDEFTVNIALIHQGSPILGVIYVPAQSVLYAGIQGEGAFRQHEGREREAIETRPVPEIGFEAVVSLSHLDQTTKSFLQNYRIASRVQAASSLKFCRVAEGAADMYPRFGPTMEWDTAAGHAIVLAAGGRVETPEGEPFTYGACDFRNGPFVAWGR